MYQKSDIELCPSTFCTIFVDYVVNRPYSVMLLPLRSYSGSGMRHTRRLEAMEEGSPKLLCIRP